LAVASFRRLQNQRRRWPAPWAGTPRGQALQLYDRLRRALARAGLAGTPSLTPDEFAESHRAALAGRPALQASVRRITALHEQAAYSQHPVGQAEAAAAERSWGRARWDRVGLLLRRLIGKRQG
jgi:hypothetical protein